VERASEIDAIEQLVFSVTATMAAAVALYGALGFESFGRERRSLKIGNGHFETEHIVLNLNRRTSL